MKVKHRLIDITQLLIICGICKSSFTPLEALAAMGIEEGTHSRYENILDGTDDVPHRAHIFAFGCTMHTNPKALALLDFSPMTAEHLRLAMHWAQMDNHDAVRLMGVETRDLGAWHDGAKPIPLWLRPFMGLCMQPGMIPTLRLRAQMFERK